MRDEHGERQPDRLDQLAEQLRREWAARKDQDTDDDTEEEQK